MHACGGRRRAGTRCRVSVGRDGQRRRVVRRAAAVSRERRSRTRAPPRRGPRRRSGEEAGRCQKGSGRTERCAGSRRHDARSPRRRPRRTLTETVSVNGVRARARARHPRAPAPAWGAPRRSSREGSGASAGPRRGQRQLLQQKTETHAPRADRVHPENENLTGQSETGVASSQANRKAEPVKGDPRATSPVFSTQPPPVARPTVDKWPLSSTPPSPRASPPPRCVRFGGPIARASRARFRGGPRTSHPARLANIQTARAQNALTPSSAPLLHPQRVAARRIFFGKGVAGIALGGTSKPDRRARGPFRRPFAMSSVAGRVLRAGPAGVPTRVLAGDACPELPSGPLRAVAWRPARTTRAGMEPLDARTPLPRCSTPRGPSIARRRGSNFATVKHTSLDRRVCK